MTAKAGRPDVYRAANDILSHAVDGRIVLALHPPGYAQPSEPDRAGEASSGEEEDGEEEGVGEAGMGEDDGTPGEEEEEEGEEEGDEEEEERASDGSHGDVEDGAKPSRQLHQKHDARDDAFVDTAAPRRARNPFDALLDE